MQQDRDKSEHRPERAKSIKAADRDLIALGIATAAIIMFVGTGGSVLPKVARAFAGTGVGPDKLLINALLLNIALIIFGWRRYAELTREVSERRKAEEQARILAETDPLTGCLNRRSMASATDAKLDIFRERRLGAAFLMIDLDNFKHVNDIHGHAAGDTLLRTTAARLSEVLPEDAILARLGGDEFACVVPFDPKSTTSMDRLASRLLESVSRTVDHDGIDIEGTISIGGSRSDLADSSVDSEALLHMADIAMYYAKKQGRNRHYWFEPAMESELRFRSELEAGVRRGVANNEFVPYYEKQIDLGTGELVGFEMLARWNSPNLGIVSPEIFIPIAEDIGVIGELSEQLIRVALEDAKSWNPRLTLSVNISPIQMRDPWFAQRLLKILVEVNFPPSRLEIEITESALHDNIGLVRSMISSLKNQGIRVSLDDFGTGYSSLSQLRSLPFDRIKIDRSFITSLGDNRENATIVNSIISMGEGLGLPITAEGVESEEVLHALKGFGQMKGQGYLYGRPEDAQRTRDELAQLDLLLDVPGTAAPVAGTQPADTIHTTDRKSANG